MYRKRVHNARYVINIGNIITDCKTFNPAIIFLSFMNFNNKFCVSLTLFIHNIKYFNRTHTRYYNILDCYKLYQLKVNNERKKLYKT